MIPRVSEMGQINLKGDSMIRRVYLESLNKNVTSTKNKDLKEYVLKIRNKIRQLRNQKQRMVYENNIKKEKEGHKKIMLEKGKMLVELSQKSRNPQIHQWGAKLNAMLNSFN
jgi:hypothetical protein